MAREVRSPVTLEDFIAPTLEQIMAGVYRAQIAIVDEYPGASINPGLRERPARKDPDVEFDVAVTAVEGKKEGGGAGIIVIGIGGGGLHTASECQTSHVSHIKFSVPIILCRTRKKAPDRLGACSLSPPLV